VRQLIPLPYGYAARTQRDPLGFLLEGAQKFGPVFRYQVGPWSFHLVSRPDGVLAIFCECPADRRGYWLGEFKALVETVRLAN